MLRISIAGQHLSSLQVFSFSSYYLYKIKMYSKFVFGNFDHKNLNKRQCHPRGAFLEVFDGTDGDNMLWYCKKRMYQEKLWATADNTATNMVALFPQSSRNPLHVPLNPSSANKVNSDKSAPWNVPRSFVLNFYTIDPYTEEPLGEFSFPYYSSYFHNTCQLYIWKPSLILSPTLANPVILTTFFVFLPNSTSISTQKIIFMTSSTLFLVKNLILNLLIIYKSNILTSTFSTLFLQKFYFQSPIPKFYLLFSMAYLPPLKLGRN